jgi:rubrerythrin
MVSRLEEIEAYVRPQMAMDLNTIVQQQDLAMKTLLLQMKQLDEKTENVTSRMVKMSKSVSVLQDDLSVKIPEQFAKVGDRIDRLGEEQRTQEDGMRMFEGVLKQVSNELCYVICVMCGVCVLFCMICGCLKGC